MSRIVHILNKYGLNNVFHIRELYEYASTVRRKFLDKLEFLPWEEVSKNREASHYV
ncbi:MAG: hypothetical protein HY619_00455 [Thaumarchaeota archaeon]|nr:hypothetical protein [Nitrososphaerota archaeon]